MRSAIIVFRSWSCLAARRRRKAPQTASRSTDNTAPGATRAPSPRMPTRDMLRERTPEEVEIALSTFTMRRQGAALNSAERRAVSEYVTGRPPGSYRAPLEVIAADAFCTDGAGDSDPLGGPA